MINKIKQIIREQIRLVDPLIKNGTTTSIRMYAYNESVKLENILESDSDNFFEKNRDTIISCCISLYSKLNEDSRTLPTIELRELAKKEADNVMKIWTKIENDGKSI